MSIKNLTLPQALLAIALVAATIATYKLFGEVPAGLLLVLSSFVNFLLGRSSTDGAP